MASLRGRLYSRTTARKEIVPQMTTARTAGKTSCKAKSAKPTAAAEQEQSNSIRSPGQARLGAIREKRTSAAAESSMKPIQLETAVTPR